MHHPVAQVIHSLGVELIKLVLGMLVALLTLLDQFFMNFHPLYSWLWFFEFH
jgi:hypothetical protein